MEGYVLKLLKKVQTTVGAQAGLGVQVGACTVHLEAEARADLARLLCKP